MASLPYVTAAGNVDKALNGIRQAAVPERVSQDFVKTILKIPGGSGAQMTSYLRKLGFAGTDGSPTDRYKKFRNPTSSGAAVFEAIKTAYAPLYIRNEFMHELPDADLVGLVVEETGEAHDSSTVRYIVSCIKHLKQFASFTAAPANLDSPPPIHTPAVQPPAPRTSSEENTNKSFGLNLGYTINLNLPATADPEVFDAIFKSLKEHLLRGDDA